MADSVHLWVKTAAVKGFTKEFSGNGIKFILTLNGDRAELDSLGDFINSAATNKLADVASACGDDVIAGMIPDDVLARTPVLQWSGEGLKADLVVNGDAGLKEGDSTINEGTQAVYDIPGSASARVVFEPNDVDLKYGLPFRAGKKWDLEVTLDSISAQYPIPPEITSVLLPEDSLLAVINKFEAGTFSDTATRNAVLTFIQQVPSLAQWFIRTARGQTNYRTWVPSVTVTRRYRTMPTNDQSPDDVPAPGALCTPNGDAYVDSNGEQWMTEIGPPQWTGAPIVDVNGEQYVYLRGGSQVEFAGDMWVVELQYNGFLGYDAALYTNSVAV